MPIQIGQFYGFLQLPDLAERVHKNFNGRGDFTRTGKMIFLFQDRRQRRIYYYMY